MSNETFFGKCKQGHDLSPDNIYINRTSGQVSCAYCVRNGKFLAKYGITLDQRDEILNKQNSLCIDCRNPLLSGKNIQYKFSDSGQLLAIVCNQCGYNRNTHCKNGHEFSSDNIYVSNGKRSCRTCAIDRQLRHSVGISLEEKFDRFRKQNGLCALCQEPTNKPCVDHDHKTGIVRELLCPVCNKALGLFKDDPELLEKAAAYIRKHKPCLV